jgi:hypothetical protein
VDGEPLEDRTHEVERVDAVGARFGPHQPPQLVGNQGMDNHGCLVAGFVDNGVDLARRADMGPTDQPNRRILKLDQRGPYHPLGRVAGGVGNDKNGEHQRLILWWPPASWQAWI